MDSVAILITQSYEEDSIGQMITKDANKREIPIHIKAITRSEFYSAGQAGISPEFIFLTAAVNYNNEKVIEFCGNRYSVYRVYNVPESDDVELYLQKASGVTV